MSIKIYQEINKLEEIGLIAGSSLSLQFACYGADGNPINLTESGALYGCSFSYYGEESNPLFIVTGTQLSGYTNIMNVELSSQSTANLPNCCLSYQPYIDIDGNVVRPGQGRIIVQAAIPMSLS